MQHTADEMEVVLAPRVNDVAEDEDPLDTTRLVELVRKKAAVCMKQVGDDGGAAARAHGN